MENDQKIQELSRLQQSLANISAQKEQYSIQLSEYDSAIKLLEANDTAYKIIGGIMVKSSKEVLKKELNEKKEIAQLRINSFEKQERKIRQNSDDLQKEIMSEMDN